MKIKIEILPVDNCDIESLLRQLLERNLISRYSVDGREYGCVPKFLEHQKPHPREQESKIPAASAASPNHSQGTAKTTPRHDQGMTKAMTSPADILNPSSLNPESIPPSSSTYVKEEGGCNCEQLHAPPSSSHEGEESPKTDRAAGAPDYAAVLRDLWNATPNLPQLKNLSNGRKRKLAIRWREHPDLLWWRNLFTRVTQTPFLCGDNDRGWRATLDWLIANDTNALAVIEGKYDRGRPASRDGPGKRKAEREREAIRDWLRKRQSEHPQEEPIDDGRDLR